MSNITMREMLEAGVHFGHQSRYWNPKMAPYLFGQRNKIHIINLEKSLPMYGDAMNFVGKLAAKKGTIMFVGTKRSAQSVIEEEASRCGMPFVNRRWMGGLLTNYKTVKQSIQRMKDLEAAETSSTVDKMSKREQLQRQRYLDKLAQSLSGIRHMDKLPDALFVIDVGYENIAVSEAKKLGIPVVAVVDSNNNPDNVDYVIPGNDDAVRSIRLYAKGVADAILDARAAISDIESGNNEDFIEVNEFGEPVAKEVTNEKIIIKRKPGPKKKEKIAAKEVSKAEAQAQVQAKAEQQPPPADQGAEISATGDLSSMKKEKVATKEVSKAEAQAEQEPPPADQGAEISATDDLSSMKKEKVAAKEVSKAEVQVQAQAKAKTEQEPPPADPEAEISATDDLSSMKKEKIVAKEVSKTEAQAQAKAKAKAEQEPPPADLEAEISATDDLPSMKKEKPAAKEASKAEAKAKAKTEREPPPTDPGAEISATDDLSSMKKEKPATKEVSKAKAKAKTEQEPPPADPGAETSTSDSSSSDEPVLKRGSWIYCQGNGKAWLKTAKAKRAAMRKSDHVFKKHRNGEFIMNVTELSQQAELQGARGAYLQAMKLLDGKSVQYIGELFESWPPSTPSRGTYEKKAEPLSAWISRLKNAEYITITEDQK